MLDKVLGVLPYLADLERELAKASLKFGPFASAHEGYAVIKEELDELWEAVRAGRIEDARKEAVQVGAMALRFLVDCSEGRPGESDA